MNQTISPVPQDSTPEYPLSQISGWLVDHNISPEWLPIAYWLTSGLVLALAAFLANLITKKILLKVGISIIEKTETKFDDMLVKHNVLTKLSHLAPSMAIWWLAPLCFGDTGVTIFARRGSAVYSIIVLGFAINALLRAAAEVYNQFELSNRVPVKGYMQFLNVLLFATVIVLSVSAMSGVPPFLLFSGAGAITVTSMVVFKDMINNLVASIQLAGNDMLRYGEWVEMDEHNARGKVVEVTLSVVKLQDVDNTVRTVPTSAFVTGSFRNTRGRVWRILRSIRINKHSIRQMDLRSQLRIKTISSVWDIVDDVLTSSKSASDGNPCASDTNLGLFRAYLEEYLRRHPRIHANKDIYVRLLEANELGLPVQISCFTKECDLISHERVQSEIFEHIYTALPLFGLIPFQRSDGESVSRETSITHFH